MMIKNGYCDVVPYENNGNVADIVPNGTSIINRLIKSLQIK